MNEYGGFTYLSDGALKDPDLRARAVAACEREAAEIERKYSIKLGAIEFIEHHHNAQYKPSLERLLEDGFSEADAKEHLAWADEQEWPMYRDLLGWRARTINEKVSA